MSESSDEETPLWHNPIMPTISTEEHVSFKFIGPALQNSSIDMADFGRSLIGYSRLVQAAVQVVAPSAKVPDVQITRAEGGSFETFATITIDQSVIDSIRGFFSSQNMAALAAMVTVSGFSLRDLITGPLRLIEWKRGREEVATQELSNGDTRVTLSDNDTADVPSIVYKISHSNVYLGAVKDFASPLENEGIDQLEMPDKYGVDNGQGPLALGKEILNYLPDDNDSDTRLISEQSVTLKVLTAPLYQGKGWRFRREDRVTGESYEFTATMQDEPFLVRVARKEVPIQRGLYIVADLVTEIPSRKRGHRRYYVTRVSSEEVHDEIDFGSI